MNETFLLDATWIVDAWRGSGECRQTCLPVESRDWPEPFAALHGHGVFDRKTTRQMSQLKERSIYNKLIGGLEPQQRVMNIYIYTSTVARKYMKNGLWGGFSREPQVAMLQDILSHIQLRSRFEWHSRTVSRRLPRDHLDRLLLRKNRPCTWVVISWEMMKRVAEKVTCHLSRLDLRTWARNASRMAGTGPSTRIRQGPSAVGSGVGRAEA